MKKMITITTMIFVTSLIATSVFAWCGGGMGNVNVTANSGNAKDTQAFYDNTTDLRASLAANVAERAAVMSAETPNPERVRTLTETIVKQQDELRKAADKYNVTLMGMGMGMGMGKMGNGANNGTCPYQDGRMGMGKHMMK